MAEEQTQALTVRLPVELHTAARHKSLDIGKSLNEIIIEKLAEWVKETNGKNPKTGKTTK